MSVCSVGESCIYPCSRQIWCKLVYDTVCVIHDLLHLLIPLGSNKCVQTTRRFRCILLLASSPRSVLKAAHSKCQSEDKHQLLHTSHGHAKAIQAPNLDQYQSRMLSCSKAKPYKAKFLISALKSKVHNLGWHLPASSGPSPGICRGTDVIK